jgi:hypothetical protein
MFLFLCVSLGFWGFGEQYVTERKDHKKTVTIALGSDKPAMPLECSTLVRGTSVSQLAVQAATTFVASELPDLRWTLWKCMQFLMNAG